MVDPTPQRAETEAEMTRLRELTPEELGTEYKKQRKLNTDAAEQGKGFTSQERMVSKGWMNFIEHTFNNRGLDIKDYTHDG